jgi:hypothetical protein
MVRRGWWRRGAAAGLAVLAAVCVSGSEDREAVRTASDLGALPADIYRLTPRDYERSQQASALLVRQCMAGRGHPDFPLDPRFPTDPIVAAAVATDYGVLDADAARRWGYGWDPAKHADSRPKGRRMTSAEYADWPGCSTDADRRLMRGIDLGDWLYGQTREAEVDKAVKRDPRVRAQWAVWSRCMAERGFAGYPDPLAAFADRAWQRGSDGNTRHTRRERDTAVADVTCKRRHGTVESWQAVWARDRAADIARHRDRYAAGLRALRRYRANIAEVLRRGGRPGGTPQ